ncbi:MAG: phosphotransferase [Saprospiraceae bacterium]|nr:phosphotransferase [Saprospiraceae bacterium]
MTADNIHQIMSEGLFPGLKSGVSLVETHISWVILTDEFAFKIKKPVRFDFLDFSTLELRRHFCEEELRLNRRLAPQMYLQVLPVSIGGIGEGQLPAMDYALQMHRMDNTREMDKLLAVKGVDARDMEYLAALLAKFHLQNRLDSSLPYHPAEDAHDFADLYALESDLEALQGSDAKLLRTWAETIPAFLYKHTTRSEARIRSGFWVEGHGDLHSRNIFLPKKETPVVFDCLEFNAHFRRLDVLSELAFLCMDLEFYGRKDLVKAFLEAYTHHWACFENAEDSQLFTYFKAYRANVRLKIALLSLRQHPNKDISKSAMLYWLLLKQYVFELTGF